MINIEKSYAGDIPFLHIAEASAEVPRPTVIFFHGFGSAKEHNLHYAYLMAEKGLRVLLPDALYHGERAGEHTEQELMGLFWPTVTRSIEEAAILKSHFEETGLADPDRWGMAGTSMGGIVTNGALAVYDWIQAAVSLMGNPAYEAYASLQIETLRKHNPSFMSEQEIARQLASIRKYDLSRQPEKLAQRPFLMWHGARDPIVPSSFAARFYESVRESYEDESKLMFVLDSQADHKVSRKGVLKTAGWFDAYLMKAGQNI